MTTKNYKSVVINILGRCLLETLLADDRGEEVRQIIRYVSKNFLDNGIAPRWHTCENNLPLIWLGCVWSFPPQIGKGSGSFLWRWDNILALWLLSQNWARRDLFHGFRDGHNKMDCPSHMCFNNTFDADDDFFVIVPFWVIDEADVPPCHVVQRWHHPPGVLHVVSGVHLAHVEGGVLDAKAGVVEAAGTLDKVGGGNWLKQSIELVPFVISLYSLVPELFLVLCMNTFIVHSVCQIFPPLLFFSPQQTDISLLFLPSPLKTQENPYQLQISIMMIMMMQDVSL